MGGIWGPREFFSDALTEIAGYKAGVVLTDAELLELMREQEEVASILDPEGPGGGRLHWRNPKDILPIIGRGFHLGDQVNPH